MDASPADWILHVDLDQFIAAVEVLRHPELAGKPLIIGGRGDPTERAVVSTASYEARAFGVGSGMPLRIAARKVPDAVILPVDADEYAAASAEVMATLRNQPEAVVQVLGWDEAFIGIRTADPEGYARAVQRAVLDRTRLHCSVGIGDTLVRAKIATGFGKPQGVFRLTADNWLEVMGDRPTIELWGVGSKISKRLAAHGINTVAELRRSRRRRTWSTSSARAWGRGSRSWAEARAPSRRRLALDRARSQPGDDVPAGPDRTRARRGGGPRADLPGARRCRRGRPAGHRPDPEGALRAVLHEDLREEDPGDERSGCRGRAGARARRRSASPTGRSGCWDSAPRCRCPTGRGRRGRRHAGAGDSPDGTLPTDRSVSRLPSHQPSLEKDPR